MAIQRDATSVNFGGAGQVSGAPDNVGYVQPDFRKTADNNARAAEQQSRPSTLDNILGAVVKPLQQMASGEITTAREEAYLTGQAAAAANQSSDSVNSNLVTKDWATAGYADTKGRLAQADAEAQTAVDMAKLKEQDPQKMREYLAQRRNDLMPSLDGMSLDARKGFLAQQLTSDRAAIAKHSVEHQKFIVDQITQSVSTGMSVRFDAMTNAKTDAVAYKTAADDAYAGMYNNVWSNPNLPHDSQVKLTTEAAVMALGQNHQALYENMRDQKLPGKDTTMLDALPFDDQVKLSKAYEQSKTDTAGMRLADFNTQRGLMEAGFGDALSPAMSFKDVKAFVDQGLQNGAIKAGDVTSITKAWAEGNEKKMVSSKLAGAYASGDVNTMFGLDKSEGDGYKAFIAQAARNNVDPATTVGNLLQIGTTTGQQSAFKGVGELTRSAVSAIGMGGTIDPGQAKMLNTVFTALDAAQAKGQSGAMSAYLTSFSDDERSKIMMYREGLQSGKAPAVAAADAADKLMKTSQLSEQEKNVLAQNHAKADMAVVADITPRGLWGTIKNNMPDIVRSQDAINEGKIGTGKGWFENPDRVEQALAQSKSALLEELNYASRSNPFASDDSRKSLALSKVAERTLDLKDGPLVLPRLPSGTTVQDYFGVNKSIPTSTIQDTLSELHKAGDGNRVAYKVTGQSQLQWQEYGKNGELVNPGGTFDPRSIGLAVQEKQDAITEKFNKTDGEGVTVKGSDGSKVTFNGNNTIGVDNGLMLQVREDLAKHESVRGTPYEDLSGKVVDGKKVQTVGVGVSSHNPFYPTVQADGTVDQHGIDSSFEGASNAAAKTGAGVVRQVGLVGSAPFRLFTELSYQGGSVNKDIVSAMKSRDLPDAMKALKASPQYLMSGAARRQHYEDLTEASLKFQ